MIKRIAIKTLTIASYILVALLDLTVMMAVFSMVSRMAIVFGATDAISFAIGAAGAIIAFGHLKFRHKIRHFGKTSDQCQFCGTDQGCQDVCDNCLKICSGGEIEEYGNEDANTTIKQGETK